MGPSKIHAKQSVEVDFAEWEETLLRVSVTSQNVKFGNPGSLYLAFALIYIYFFSNLNTKQNKWVTAGRANGTPPSCQLCHTCDGTNEQVSHLLSGEQAGVLQVVTCWWRDTCYLQLQQFSPVWTMWRWWTNHWTKLSLLWTLSCCFCTKLKDAL